RRRQPVPRLRGVDRSRPARDRAQARAASRLRRQRLRVGGGAFPFHPARGDRDARGGDHGARSLRRPGRRPLPELRQRRAAPVRPGRDGLRARAALRAGMTVVVNPATAAEIAEVPEAGLAETDRAVAAAKAAFPAWRAIAPSDRARLLRRLAAVVEEHGEELA